MDPLHYKVWDRCATFVARVCAGRDASHGLAHMRKVTEQAVLLCFMDMPASTTNAERAGMLYRILLVGMLHDVADHKYDHDGTLFQQVDAFVEAEAATLLSHLADAQQTDLHIPLPCRASDGDAVARVKQLLLTSLEAISYSKENKRGKRWFVPLLSCTEEEKENPSSSTSSAAPCSWVAVRDYVSDADKLEAIGAEGLLRCYEYTCERYRSAATSVSRTTAVPIIFRDAAEVSRLERHVEQEMLADVVVHFHEKLKRLLPEFIVTATGKYLGTPRDEEMTALLAEWQARGPPPVTMYWRHVASEYVPNE
jgi:phage tail protein X